jgi:phosphotriesterase-related protein
VVRRRDLLLAPLAAQAPAPPSILVHEHVLVDFIGAAAIQPGRYDTDVVASIALPHLKAIHALGCRRLLECTPNFLGRDPKLLTRLARESGIEIWTNTGLYGAADFKFLPNYAQRESATELSARWIAEAREGIDGVKPRFIKIGVNRGPLHPLDRKLMEAAVLSSRATGLTIASHTGNGAAALDQLDILNAMRHSPSKWVWVHAQNEADLEIHARIAKAGAWVEFDGISPKSIDRHVECIRFMAGHGLLHRTLISQDAGWFHVGEPQGGSYRAYTSLYTDFLPKVNPDWHLPLLWTNPQLAFGAKK